MVKRKILVLCIDRDDDLGKKAGVKTPLIGSKANIKGASALALADPTESDINAIFQAVKTYKDLKKSGDDAIVATIAGHKSRGSRADKNVVKQLEYIIKKEEPTEVVFISDGADDEQVLPMVQSRIKVSGVKTVIVKQAKELEKSYYVIKEVLRDPHFARLVFGLPGIVLAIYGAVNLLNIQDISLNIVLALVGGYLIFKGFGIEDTVVKAFKMFVRTTSVERASFPLYIASALVFLLALWSGFDNISFVWNNVPSAAQFTGATANIITLNGFAIGAAGLFMLSLVLFLVGRMGDMYYSGYFHRIRKYARSIVSVIAAWVIIEEVARFVLYWTGAATMGPQLTDLFISVGIAFFITLIGFLSIKYLYITRYVMKKLEKGMPVRDLEGIELGKITSIDYKKKWFRYGAGPLKRATEFSKVLSIRDNVIVE